MLGYSCNLHVVKYIYSFNNLQVFCVLCSSFRWICGSFLQQHELKLVLWQVGVFQFTAGYLMHCKAVKQRLIYHQRVHSPRGNLECLLQLSCVSADCGRKVECLEESHADTRRTWKPHTARISCLGTELFINCGCDHFWTRCGFFFMWTYVWMRAALW